MQSQADLYSELSYYTLAHSDPSFIHQHAVDAYAAQAADGQTKPIKIFFALVGLYLYIERDYTGKQVQLAHMELAKKQLVWPVIDLPDDRGAITVADVISAHPGQERDLMIFNWCESVWNAYRDSHSQIEEFLKIYYFG